ncbi:DNA-3-methyladenine glycosylase family protein [Mycolicibacterium baixiangningiae]|uniref:DNA-3-methyladenine glycosylase family protein n=1 Tax=Mycolicibacterium baixiangningiae TaxID=2761578 RepID=UPI0018D0FEB2|nr:DNA-3-methyladenine glycosylase 2 family protein [Mycolicibacterium baixiangningiae]
MRADQALRRSVTFGGPVSPALTLSPLRRGGGDPCFTITADGATWRTSLPPSGPVTARITRSAPDAVDLEAWGAGAEEFLDGAPALLGAEDDAAGFAPQEPTLAAAHRRIPHLRLGRTGRVLEALIPAVLEQRVSGIDAFRAWRLLVTKYGTAAPGPAPTRMRVPPGAQVWRRIPSWEFHRANVDPGRARTVVLCAQRADSLERLSARPPEQARAALTSLPGVGVWTAAETAQRAWGDADALSVGDYHLAKTVGWSLLGHPIDDPAMLDLLEPIRPHRHRAVRVLLASGLARNPRFGARLAIPRLAEL